MFAYRQHHKTWKHKTTHPTRQVWTLYRRDLAQSPRPRAVLGIRWTAQTHRGASAPKLRSTQTNWLVVRAAAGVSEQMQRRCSRWEGWGEAAWEAKGREREAAEETELGPREAWNIFNFSQVRLRYRSLEATVPKDRTVDLSELTLHQAAIIGKQAPGERNQRSYIIQHKGFSPALFVLQFKTHPKELGPYSGVHEVVGLVGQRGFFCVLGVGEVVSSWKEWSCH